MKGQENIESHKWEKGQSGNPNGRPRGQALSTILKTLLDGTTTIDEEGKKKKITRNEQIALSLLKEASNGNVQAIKEIFDRTEGKAQQFIDHTSKGESINKPKLDLSKLSNGTLKELEINMERNKNGKS